MISKVPFHRIPAYLGDFLRAISLRILEESLEIDCIIMSLNCNSASQRWWYKCRFIHRDNQSIIHPISNTHENKMINEWLFYMLYIFLPILGRGQANSVCDNQNHTWLHSGSRFFTGMTWFNVFLAVSDFKYISATRHQPGRCGNASESVISKHIII